MNEGARLENEAMYRRSVRDANESQNKKLDHIIDLLEKLVSAQHRLAADENYCTCPPPAYPGDELGKCCDCGKPIFAAKA